MSKLVLRNPGSSGSQNVRGGAITSFKVWRVDNGNYEELTSGQEAFINTVLPYDMAGYFISDGEGGDLQIDENALLPVGRSIEDILGFGVAEQAILDIQKLRKQVVSELKDYDVADDIIQLQESVEQARTEKLSAETRINDNREVQSRYDQELEEAEAKLRAIDVGEAKRLAAERLAEERRLESYKNKSKKLRGERVELVRRFSWAAFASKLRTEALDFIDEAEFKGKLPAPFNVQLVEDILGDGACICGASVPEGSAAYERIRALLNEASNPDIINRVHRARSRLTAIKTRADGALEELTKNLTNRSETDAQIYESQRLIQDFGINLERIDDTQIRELEKRRRTLKAKLEDTKKAIWRDEGTVARLAEEIKKNQAEAGKLEALSPKARNLYVKRDLLDQTEQVIAQELNSVRSTVFDELKEQIDLFLEKYLTHDYRIKITEGFKIGLVNKAGNIVPTSGGQSAILSFIYISSLVRLAKKYTSVKSNILTPGAIAPLIYDAPFSSLNPNYAKNVATQLPELVDQLIILMYQDESKDVEKILTEAGRLGKVYYLNAHITGEAGEKTPEQLKIAGKPVVVTHYNADFDAVEIIEGKDYA